MATITVDGLKKQLLIGGAQIVLSSHCSIVYLFPLYSHEPPAMEFRNLKMNKTRWLLGPHASLIFKQSLNDVQSINHTKLAMAKPNHGETAGWCRTTSTWLLTGMVDDIGFTTSTMGLFEHQLVSSNHYIPNNHHCGWENLNTYFGLITPKITQITLGFTRKNHPLNQPSCYAWGMLPLRVAPNSRSHPGSGSAQWDQT